MRSFFAVLVAAAALIAAPASAQELWQDTEVGMTPDQIRRVHPNARPPAERSTLRNGATCELEIPDYEVGGMAFRVCFYTRSSHLIQVMLSSEAPTEPQFQTMADLLRARYGREVSTDTENCRPNRSLRLCSYGWLLPSGTNVSILYMDVGGQAPLLNIVYQTRVRDGANRL